MTPVWRSLVPAIAVALYFVIAFAAFCVISWRRGVPRDREIEARGQSLLINAFFRNYFVWVVRPIWRLLVASGLPANAITAMAAVLAAASGVAVATGSFALGGWLFLLSGILDVMDGRIARARGEDGPLGGVADSVLDRYSDSFVLMGLAWYFRSSWILVPALAALLGTSVVPYVRAKAEAMGIAMSAGLMQRAERILYLGAALALTPILEAILAPGDPRPFPRLAAAAVIFLAVSTNLTAAKRFLVLIEAVGEPRHHLGRPLPRRARSARER